MAYIHYLVLALAVLTLGPTLCAGSLHPPHTQHHLARTNAEAFASGQRVLPPSSFALRQDPSGRSRMLPGTKTRVKRAQASAKSCAAPFVNVQARVTVTSASGAFLGYLATSPSGSGYVITNSLSVALVVKLQATVPNMPYVLVDVRHSKFIGASQLGNPLAVAKGSAGYALLYQTSPSGSTLTTTTTTSGALSLTTPSPPPPTIQASIWLASCLYGVYTLTGTYLSLTGTHVAAEFFYFLRSGGVGLTGDFNAFQWAQARSGTGATERVSFNLVAVAQNQKY